VGIGLSDQHTVTLWLLTYDKASYQPQDNDIAQLGESEFARYQSCGISRQKEFLLSRLLLRQALTVQLDCPIVDLEVEERQSMPPAVRLADDKGIRFSISHSNSLVAVAMARRGVDDRGVLGLDVEYMRHDRSLAAARMFCNQEQQRLIENAQCINEKRRLYYLFWSQKEAYFKACFYTATVPTLRSINFRAAEQSQVYDLSATELDFSINGQTERYQCATYASWSTIPRVKKLMLNNNSLSVDHEEIIPNWSCYSFVN